MQYRFATDPPDHSDLASGRVIHGLPGHPAFPVRLIDEVFQRCLAIQRSLAVLAASGRTPGPCTIYDPCCGSAYHLAALGYLHRPSIRAILASDVDPDALGVARRNLELLGVAGMDRRSAELRGMIERFGKDSHREALASAERLRENVLALATERPLETRTFQANALDPGQLREHLRGTAVDVVFADVPYGLLSGWKGTEPGEEGASPLWRLLDALRGILPPTSVVALAFDKAQKAAHEGYRRLERFQVGKRRLAILAPIR
jgi:hypothetical protein